MDRTNAISILAWLEPVVFLWPDPTSMRIAPLGLAILKPAKHPPAVRRGRARTPSTMITAGAHIMPWAPAMGRPMPIAVLVRPTHAPDLLMYLNVDS